MKQKSVITILSVALNVVLFTALVYFNKINSTIQNAPAVVFHVQHLNDLNLVQNDSHEIVAAGAVK